MSFLKIIFRDLLKFQKHLLRWSHDKRASLCIATKNSYVRERFGDWTYSVEDEELRIESWEFESREISRSKIFIELTHRIIYRGASSSSVSARFPGIRYPLRAMQHDIVWQVTGPRSGEKREKMSNGEAFRFMLLRAAGTIADYCTSHINLINSQGVNLKHLNFM